MQLLFDVLLLLLCGCVVLACCLFLIASTPASLQAVIDDSKSYSYSSMDCDGDGDAGDGSAKAANDSSWGCRYYN